MIVGGLALFFNFVAMAALAFFFGVAVVCTFGLFHNYWRYLDANGRRRLLWLAVSIPWFLGFGVPVLFVLSLWGDVPWIAHLMHWHHFNTFNFYSWHAYPIIVLLVICVVVGARAYRSATIHLKAYGLLKLALNDKQLLESDVPQAFSAGFWVPEVFVSTGLIDQLESHELQIVELHEQAHVNSYDSLKKLAFSFFSSFLPSLVAQPMRKEMSLCIEQRADEYVVSQGTNRADVAMTLLKVTKLMRDYGASRGEEPFNCAFDGSEVRARVAYLMLQQPARGVSFVLMIALVSVIALLCLLSVDGVHHVIETLFIH